LAAMDLDAVLDALIPVHIPDLARG
jgi:hypothetical protein